MKAHKPRQAPVCMLGFSNASLTRPSIVSVTHGSCSAQVVSEQYAGAEAGTAAGAHHWPHHWLLQHSTYSAAPHLIESCFHHRSYSSNMKARKPGQLLARIPGFFNAPPTALGCTPRRADGDAPVAVDMIHSAWCVRSSCSLFHLPALSFVGARVLVAPRRRPCARRDRLDPLGLVHTPNLDPRAQSSQQLATLAEDVA